MSELCGVCAGTGKPVSGLPCICGGSGAQSDELYGLRLELSRAKEEINKKDETIKELSDALEKLACLGNGDFCGNSEGNMVAREALTRISENS